MYYTSLHYLFLETLVRHYFPKNVFVDVVVVAAIGVIVIRLGRLAVVHDIEARRRVQVDRFSSVPWVHGSLVGY